MEERRERGRMEEGTEKRVGWRREGKRGYRMELEREKKLGLRGEGKRG